MTSRLLVHSRCGTISGTYRVNPCTPTDADCSSQLGLWRVHSARPMLGFMNAKTEKMAVVGALLLLAGCGGGTGGSAPSPSQLSLLAGNVDGPGSADGIGAAARFDHPGSAATDLSGNVYVADTTNSTIRKITPGAVVTTLAGTAGSFGSEDGIGAAARFQYPVGTATDASGNVYVADSGNDTIRKITPGGASGDVSNPANWGRVKTGQWPGPETRFASIPPSPPGATCDACASSSGRTGARGRGAGGGRGWRSRRRRRPEAFPSPPRAGSRRGASMRARSGA